jgi:hypothetical protein
VTLRALHPRYNHNLGDDGWTKQQGSRDKEVNRARKVVPARELTGQSRG